MVKFVNDVCLKSEHVALREMIRDEPHRCEEDLGILLSEGLKEGQSH